MFHKDLVPFMLRLCFNSQSFHLNKLYAYYILSFANKSELDDAEISASFAMAEIFL
jgi:hypothetical protein